MRLSHKFFLLLSQTLNVIASGDPDESFSARAYRTNNEKLIRRIDRLLGADHCKQTYDSQLIRQSARYSSR